MKRKLTALSMLLILTSCGDKVENNYLQTPGELESLKSAREAREGSVEYNASTYIENPNFLIHLGKEPNKGSTDYFSVVERVLGSGKKAVKIHGLEIRVASDSQTDIKISENLDLVEINTEVLVIDRPIFFPGANLVINAKKLIFTGNGLISIKPNKILTAAPLATDGETGLSAGSITLNVGSLELGEGRIRFDISGGNGQDAGYGIPGKSGKDVVPYHGSVVSICTTIEKQCRDTLAVDAQENSEVSCVTNTPGNGLVGTKAGVPGGGGDGGSLNYINYEVLESHVKKNPGLQGLPAPITLGGSAGNPKIYYREHKVKYETKTGPGCGGRRGRPELFKRDFDLAFSQNITLLGQTAAGANIESPQYPNSFSEKGILTRKSTRKMNYESRLLALKLSYAKDLYRNYYFEKALVELEELMNSGDREREVFSEVIFNEAEQLINQLKSHKDIDGLAVNHVPLLSLPKILAAYKNEIDNAFDTLKFVSYFSNKIKSVQEMQKKLLERQDVLRLEIDSFEEQDKKANLGLTEAIKVSYEVESSELAFREALRAVEAEIEQEARQNIHSRESKRKLLGTVRFISNLAKVFPAGQPALGTIATGLDSVMTMSENENGSFVDNLKDGYAIYSDLRAGLTSYEWKKSKNDWNDKYSELYYDKYVANNPQITNKKLEKYLQNLVDANKPLMKEAANYYKNIVSRQVPQGEYQQEVQRIKLTHPRFNMVIVKLEELQGKKEKFDTLINQNMAIISQAQTGIFNNLLFIGTAQTQREKLVKGLNFDVHDSIRLIERKAKERLREYKKLLIKAYNYRLLTPYKGSYDIEKIEEQFYKFSKSNGDTINIDIVKELYRADVAEIAKGIFDVANIEDFREYETSLTYELNQNELKALTEGNAIFFNPEAKRLLHNDEENLRVKAIIVSDIDVELKDLSRSLDISLSQVGPMEIERFGKTYVFDNNTNNTGVQWKTRYDPFSGELNQVKESRELNNLYDIIYGNDSMAEIDLYIKPGLKTNYMIKLSENVKNLSGLRITIEYSYSIKK